MTHRNRSNRNAFTLVELMLSVALLIILLYGINYIFSTSADAVSAGQNVNAFTRDQGSVQPILFDDLRNAIKDPPFFIIASRQVNQFLNSVDAQTTTDPATIPTDNKGTTVQVVPALYSFRSHRCDLLEFFAKGYYRRHTANPGSYSSSTTSEDAFVQIGHVALPNNDSSGFVGPENSLTSYPPNSVGQYAADWVLGRTAICFKDNSLVAETHLQQASAAPAPYTGLENVTPLGFNSLASDGTTLVQSSRYDLASVTIDQYRKIIADAVIGQINSTPVIGSPLMLWWNPLVYQTTPTVTVASPVAVNFPNPPMARFQANPLLNAPIDSTTIAQMSPYFLQHCSQFIVEYAGDYLTQDNNLAGADPGKITGIGGDGTIDYYFDKTNNTRHIRWYGMPRSTSGGASIRGYNPGVDAVGTVGTSNQFTDVIPLSDYYSLFTGTALGAGRVVAPFEVDCSFPPAANYANAGNFPANSRYVCAWYNDTPAMIRVLMKLDDPTNKVQDGPWFEFVFKLK